MSNITSYNTYFEYNKQFLSLERKYKIVKDLYEGTEALRRNTTFYLPKEIAESEENYKLRLDRTILFNQFKKTIDTSVGKMFTKPMTVTTNQTRIDEFCLDVDGYGTTIQQFTKEVSRDAIQYGIGYILVDYPQTGPDITLADEIDGSIAPYLVKINPRDVMDIKVGYENRNAILKRFRFKEIISSFQNDVETELEQVRIFNRDDNGVVSFEVWRKDSNGKQYMYEEGIINGIDIIPIVPVYGNKTSHFVGSPVLYDLAEMNVLHYKAYSDYANIIHTIQCPLMVIKGYTPEINPDGSVKKVVVSPNSIFTMPSPDGDIKFVEVTGGSVNAGKDMITDLENKMHVMSLEIISNKPDGSETATGRIIDAAEQNSVLKGIVLDVESAIEQTLLYVSVYMGLADTQIEVNIDTSYTVLNDSNINNLIAAYKEGIIDANAVRAAIEKQYNLLNISNETLPVQNN